MSEQKYIVVKLPHEELKKKLDILNKAGIKIYTDFISKNDKAICFDIIGKDVFSTHDRAKKGDEFVPSWREFILEILKYYFCEVKTSGQADFLYDSIGQGSKTYGYKIYFRYKSVLNRFGFFSDFYGKEQLTFKGFKLLLNSTKENDMQDKNQQTINLELTPQEVAFLTAFISSGDGSTKNHLHLKGIRFMDDFIDCGKKSLLWKKLDKSLNNPLGLNGGIYNLEQLEPLF